MPFIDKKHHKKIMISGNFVAAGLGIIGSILRVSTIGMGNLFSNERQKIALIIYTM